MSAIRMPTARTARGRRAILIRDPGLGRANSSITLIPRTAK